MKREDKIASIRLGLMEGKRDIDIRRAIDVPKRTYFYWKSLIEQGKYVSLVNKQKPVPSPYSTSTL